LIPERCELLAEFLGEILTTGTEYAETPQFIDKELPGDVNDVIFSDSPDALGYFFVLFDDVIEKVT
jgi:hypothetical protein